MKKNEFNDPLYFYWIPISPESPKYSKNETMMAMLWKFFDSYKYLSGTHIMSIMF